MKMYIFTHLTWWCLEIRDEFEGLAFPAFVDDATVVARQADAASSSELSRQFQTDLALIAARA